MNETGHSEDERTGDPAGTDTPPDTPPGTTEHVGTDTGSDEETPDSAAHAREVDAAIVRLRSEIEGIHDDDPESRRELGLLADRLARRLEEKRRIEGHEPADNAVLDMVNTYESRYPQVTLMINDIVTRLSSMGI